MVEDGEPLIAYEFEASRAKRFAEGSGLPVNISTIELIEIGAGGGSIAAIDALGLLKVGPRSAGAAPGPACYGRGGEHATVTDANLVLGFLDAATFAGGTMAIDRERAEAAIRPLASRSKLSIAEARVGHPFGRQREHGGGGARARGRARPSCERVRAARDRRRRSAPRLRGGEASRHPARDLPAGRRRGLGAGLADGAGPHRPRGDRRQAAERNRLDARSKRRFAALERDARAVIDATLTDQARVTCRARRPTCASSARGSSSSRRCRRALFGSSAACAAQGVSRRVPPHLRPGAAGRRDRDHQYPRRSRARRSDAARSRWRAARGCGGSDQGQTQGVAREPQRICRNAGVRPLRAERLAPA